MCLRGGKVVGETRRNDDRVARTDVKSRKRDDRGHGPYEGGCGRTEGRREEVRNESTVEKSPVGQWVGTERVGGVEGRSQSMQTCHKDPRAGSSRGTPS